MLNEQKYKCSISRRIKFVQCITFLSVMHYPRHGHLPSSARAALAEELNFSRAAELAYLTQSAFSRRIFSEASDLDREIHFLESAHAGQVSIGAGTTIAASTLPGVTRRFRTAHPQSAASE